MLSAVRSKREAMESYKIWDRDDGIYKSTYGSDSHRKVEVVDISVSLGEQLDASCPSSSPVCPLFVPSLFPLCPLLVPSLFPLCPLLVPSRSPLSPSCSLVCSLLSHGLSPRLSLPVPCLCCYPCEFSFVSLHSFPGVSLSVLSFQFAPSACSLIYSLPCLEKHQTHVLLLSILMST